MIVMKDKDNINPCHKKKSYTFKQVEKTFKREEFYLCTRCGKYHKYTSSHAYDLSFEVLSNYGDAEAVDERKLLLGLLRRMVDMVENPHELTEACGCFDTYEIDDWKK